VGVPSKLAKWDLFISQASEDKELFVRPLAACNLGLKVWYDEFTLKVGDSLSHSINRGLIDSEFGVVVLSKNFFAKEWPQRELGALEAKIIHTRNKVILPVWYNISAGEIAGYSLTLADTFALTSNDDIGTIASKLKEQILEKKKTRAKPNH
jgi:hypothetical protein